MQICLLIDILSYHIRSDNTFKENKLCPDIHVIKQIRITVGQYKDLSLSLTYSLIIKKNQGWQHP